jgi:hypothetical protein
MLRSVPSAVPGSLQWWFDAARTPLGWWKKCRAAHLSRSAPICANMI